MTNPMMSFIKELDWLKNNLEFEERPASIAEFLGDNYLNIDSGVRPGLKKVLNDIFGEESQPYSLAKYDEAMMTGAIGIGKTTFASIVLPYMVHWVLCVKDPQKFFGLLPGSRIAFMMMSTSEDQAREVIFADVFARIKHSPWFKKYPYDDKFKNQIRWPQKDIWILPGDSAETTFEGYNILGGVLDEMDSHRVTAKKDYAMDGYDTISNRIKSRFQDRGLLILIGQMKKAVGFAATMYQRFLDDKNAYVSRMTIWESFGWEHPRYLKDDGTRDAFWFDTRRKTIIPDLVAEVNPSDNYIQIPTVYKKSFLDNPDKALKDLAGIPPAVGAPFIGMVHKIDSCTERWHERFQVAESPVAPTLSEAIFAPWFRANDRLRRVMHIDIAYSDTGDALGMAMGHVRELKEIEGELRPVIVFDFLLRMRPIPGQEIVLSDIRSIIYRVKDELGFNLKTVTLDGFQSTDTIQQLNKKRFNADYLSVDRNMLPYQDLRDAIYEERLEFPKYLTYMSHGADRKVEIAHQELTQLIDTGKKVDHPIGGSKDVADTMAGVVHILAGDRTYRRGVSSANRPSPDADEVASYDPTQVTPFEGGSATSVPVPPALGSLGANGAWGSQGDILNGLDSLRSRR
jgi:hypothetical protein